MLTWQQIRENIQLNRDKMTPERLLALTKRMNELRAQELWYKHCPGRR